MIKRIYKSVLFFLNICNLLPETGNVWSHSADVILPGIVEQKNLPNLTQNLLREFAG